MMNFPTGLTYREVALRTMKSAIEINDVEEFQDQMELFKDHGLKLTLEEGRLIKRTITKNEPVEQEWFEEILEIYTR